MSNSNWTALALVFCLGACQAPAPTEAGPLVYGQRCDIEVRNPTDFLSVFGRWSDDGTNFFIQPRKAAEWVTFAQSTRIKSLAKDSKHIVSVNANKTMVRIGGTEHAVLRKDARYFGSSFRGIVVDGTAYRHDAVVFWLILEGYAYRIVIRKRLQPVARLTTRCWSFAHRKGRDSRLATA